MKRTVESYPGANIGRISDELSRESGWRLSEQRRETKQAERESVYRAEEGVRRSVREGRELANLRLQFKAK